MIDYSQRAFINDKDYHSLDYDLNFETMNCNTIEYNHNNSIDKNYGIIDKFFFLNGKHYLIINKLEKKSIKIKGLSKLCTKHSDKFFLTMRLSNEYEMIEFRHVNRRCILIEYYYESRCEIHLSPCMELSEHD